LDIRGNTNIKAIMKNIRAGQITVQYDDHGFLRRIKYGDTEVLRMIYFALRDHNWNTIPHQIENEEISMRDDGFYITFDCLHRHDGADVLKWSVKINGTPDGAIVYEIQGTMLHDFVKNRAGFCVLHPLSLTGLSCMLTHPDGHQTEKLFPETVAPENPFKNIKAMAWPAAGSVFQLSFEGDLFETEDQRNWCDASFKTFCTPLDKPFPVSLKRGQTIFQRITFKPTSPLQPLGQTVNYISLQDTGAKSVVPRLGAGASTEFDSLTSEALIFLRALGLHHYRIDLYPASENWVTAFSKEYENAFSLGVPLEVALHLTNNYNEEMEAFSILCQQNKVRLKKVILFQHNALVTGQHLIDAAGKLKRTFPRVSFGAGSNYNFNEINKNRFNASGLDFITFSMDPQEHASDDLTILENAEAMSHLVKSAKKIYGASMSIHVSPVTLRKRFNPYATNPADLFIEESKKADPRQKESLAAQWTFASICSLAKGGADAVTFFQTIGNQGIMTADGNPYPVYHTLKSFAEYQGKPLTVLESSDALRVQGVILNNKVLGLMNLTGDPAEVRMSDKVFMLGANEMNFQRLSGA
jgi:hypothetical protein